MISAADKKILAAAIADSQADVYVIDARDTPAEQAKYIQAVYGILCKRVFCLMRQHAIFELNREAVQGSFPVMNGHGPFPANVV